MITEEKVIEVLRECFDPEIPVNIYDLGLIYKIKIDDKGEVKIDMSLTAPGCPVAGDLPGWVADAVARGLDSPNQVIVVGIKAEQVAATV